jgi:hypothetical protein
MLGVGRLRRVLGAAALSVGCSEHQCNDNPSSPPAVLVVDVNTLEPVCSATVTLVGNGQEWTQDAVDSSPCEGLYTEFPRQTGEFAIRVSSPGYASASASMRVTEDDCGKLVIEPDGEHDGLPGRPNVVTVGLTASD